MKRLWILTILFIAVIFILYYQDNNPAPFCIPDIISEYNSSANSQKNYKSKSSERSNETDKLTLSAWVATAYNIDYPSQPTDDSDTLKEECRNILSKAKKAGISTIYLQVRPSCDAFYNSKLFPWSIYLTGSENKAPSSGFDPLEYWVKQSHKRGIRLEAWINPYRICAGANAEHDFSALAASSPAKKHPDWVIKYNDGYYFDPGNPSVRKYIVGGITEIVKNYAVDGIQFDDYFYPAEDFDDQKTFSEYGRNFDNIGDWRRNNVNLLVKAVYNTVHKNAVNKSCVFGISPSGIWKNGSGGSDGSKTSGYEHYSECYADSVAWIKNGWIDYICPQIYWEIGDNAADFRTLVNWWSDTVQNTGVKLRIGLAGYKVGSAEFTDTWKNNGEDELSKQIKLCKRTKNISDAALFSWNDIDDNNEIYTLLRKDFSK